MRMVALGRDEAQRMQSEARYLPEQAVAIRRFIAKLAVAMEAEPVLQVALLGPVQESASEWLKTSEVARMFRVSERTVRRWCEEGQIEAQRSPSGPRGDWRIRASQFSARPDEVEDFWQVAEQIAQKYGGEVDEFER